MSEMQAVFRQPFLEQVAFFRQKLGNLVPTARWDDLWKSQHDHGFMVAGAMKADLLADFAQAVTACVAQGKSLEWFRANFDSIVEKHGWAYKGPRDWRTRVIYQTNMLTSYAAGRLAQLREFPLWIYRHSDLVTHPRPHHVVLDGLILPSNHHFWRTHYPPNGWGCCCYVLGARDAEDARLLGGDPDKRLPEGWDAIDPRTGEPAGIDKGWGYMPGGTVVDTVAALTGKLSTLPADLGAWLMELMRDMAMTALVERFAAYAQDVIAYRPHDRNMVIGAMKPKWVAAAKKAGSPPATADITVRAADVRHTHRDGKAGLLDWDWYLALPRHIATPEAVILDVTHKTPALLLVYSHTGSTSQKLVVLVNYNIKKTGIGNIVRTGRVLKTQDLRAQLGKGYELVEGEL